MTADAPASEEDWKKAEALVADFAKSTKQATEPIQLRRWDTLPFLVGAWWPESSGVKVLVYNGKVQQTTGNSDLPAYLAFLGETRLRAMDAASCDTLLGFFRAPAPTAASVGAPWAHQLQYPELRPAIVASDTSVKYVVHYVDTGLPASLPGSGGPPPRSLGSGGLPMPPGAPLVLQRWSVQLWPVDQRLAWKLEGRVERPRI